VSALWFQMGAAVVGFALFGRLRRLGTATAPSPMTDAPEVAVIIPARNEAASIGNLLSDIASLDVAPAMVIVVDDHSDDATASIASSFDVEVITAPALPVGWRGKPWACQLGADHAMSQLAPDDLLVFLDADVRLHPAALQAVVGAAAEGDVVSVQPFHELPTAVEQLSAVFNVVSLMGVGAGTASPTAVFGPVVCCTTGQYRAVDGHRSVRAAVAEDVELGRRFLQADVALRVFGGGELLRFRMYPTGLSAIVEGWSKNMATGATSIPLSRTVGAAWWISSLVAASWTYLSLVVGAASPTAPTLLATAVGGLGLAALLRRVGSFRWWAMLAYPVLVAFFVAVFVRSLWLTYVRRAVNWRGRTLDLGDDPTTTPAVP